MNKKRLYKQNGQLHARGDGVALEVSLAVQRIFERYPQYSARDVELLIIQAAVHLGRAAAYKQSLDAPPKKKRVPREGFGLDRGLQL